MQTDLNPFDRSTWSGDERRYFQLVDEALARMENRIISNGRVEHAAYIIHKFLTHATGRLRVFSGKLSRTYNGFSVYGNDAIIDAACAFLARPDRELTVVVEHGLDLEPDETTEDHPLVRAIRRKQNQLQGTIEIRRASQPDVKYLRDKNFSNHWMIMDDHAYRLETNLEKAGAHVNFADRETAGALAKIFDTILYRRADQLVRIGG